MSRKQNIVVVMVFTLLLTASIVGFRLYKAAPASPVDPRAEYETAVGGPFTLTDQNGRTVTEATLHGKPYALFFGFTRCPDICPTTMQRLMLLRERATNTTDAINIVFVSIDPEHDNREMVSGFLSMFDTPIIGLTGTPAELDRIQSGYHIYVKRVQIDGDDTIDHTATVFLMGSRGQFVSTIDIHENDDVALEKIKRAINS